MGLFFRSSSFCGVALAAACGSFGSNPNDTPPATTSDGGAADGSTPASDGASDGASEASSDAAPPRLCVGAEHWICDDFDDGVTFATAWKKNTQGDGGIAISATDAAVSSPNVFAATAPLQSTAQIFHDTTANRRGLSCSFSMRVNQIVATAITAEVVLGSGTGSYRAVVYVNPSGAQLSQQGTAPDGSSFLNVNDSFSFDKDVWHRLSIRLALGNTPEVKLSVDGVQTVNGTTNDLSQFSGSDRQTAQFGASTGATGSSLVLYDDIVCDPIP
jgi:hypothetical protein